MQPARGGRRAAAGVAPRLRVHGRGAGFELSSIVAVVVGGTALSGGRGGVAGTMAAVLLLTILATMLNLLGISPFAQRVVNGVVIVVAVAVYTSSRREP
ncbi:MAG: hypothetical protein R3C32_03990 [Chloroflexota bacterium]